VMTMLVLEFGNLEHLPKPINPLIRRYRVIREDHGVRPSSPSRSKIRKSSTCSTTRVAMVGDSVSLSPINMQTGRFTKA
jgi:hypothetical protein